MSEQVLAPTVFVDAATAEARVRVGQDLAVTTHLPIMMGGPIATAATVSTEGKSATLLSELEAKAIVGQPSNAPLVAVFKAERPGTAKINVTFHDTALDEPETTRVMTVVISRAEEPAPGRDA